ncbi:MAG: DUF3987 domain-containing protein [Candidatus Obscuribacterales bacterium]|nr:DUF3987 domain-containing protein [Candidatus Obscuribacterales bacterium]
MNESILKQNAQSDESSDLDVTLQGKCVFFPIQSWTAPTPLAEEKPLPEYESDLLPSPLREYADDIAHRIQVPQEYAAVSALSMVSTAIGAKVAICPKQYDDWMVAANTYGALVGPPGDGKSPAADAVFAPLRELEGKYLAEHKQKLLEYEVEIAAIEAQQSELKKGLNGKRTAEEIEAVKSNLLDINSPQKPSATRFIANDATIEKLAEMEVANPGLCVFRDELIASFKSWERDGREGDRAYFLEAWNGLSPFTKDRVSSGTLYVPRHCLSLFGGIQPDRIASYLRGAVSGHDNDGFVQRLQLLVFPEPIVRGYVDEYPDIAARESVDRTIKRIIDADFAGVHAYPPATPSGVPYFRFSTKPEADGVSAQDCFKLWYSQLMTEWVPKEQSKILKEHWVKYASLMPKLALLLHTVKVATATAPDVRNVDFVTARLAVRWCELLSAHARKVYSLAIGRKNSSVALLADKIRTGELGDGFTIKGGILRNGWTGLTDHAEVEAACNELVRLHWIREINAVRGGTKYAINPALLS